MMGAVLLLASALCAYVAWTAFYNLFLHPLRHYPGPKLWAITRVPYTRMYISGHAHKKILALHLVYGPVVRVAPDTLSFNHPDAWKEIRGHRKQGDGEHGKDPVFQYMNQNNIIGANRADHSRYRRAMAHGFSLQAMMDQQPLITAYVDALMSKLQTACAGGQSPVNIMSWYNYATFDIIGDLAFGEPFGCLDKSTYHPWISLLFNSMKNMAFASSMRRYPAISSLLMYFIPKEVKAKMAQHNELSREKLRKRLALRSDRPDFVDAMSKNRGGAEMSFDEMAANSAVLIIGGSETTATLLSAATYYLATTPSAMAKLSQEIRSTFNSEAEINFTSVQKLDYMLAVLNEALRMYPPVPAGGPRKIAPEGDTILGQYVPGGTIAEIWHYAVYRNPAHFKSPTEFIPERWLDDPRFASDKKEAFQPFSYGPRNCIGQNLAYAEMRLILARTIWNFDIKLAESSRDWDKKSTVHILWQKGPMDVYLTPRHSN